MTIASPDSTLIGIVAKAITLRERLAGMLMLDITTNHPAQNEQNINARLQRWVDSAAKGDVTKFARRLAWDRLTVAAVRPWLGDVHWPIGTPLPRGAG